MTTLHLPNPPLPRASHLGLDLSSFTTTATFHGIHSLPPGLHHIWLSPPPHTLRGGLWLLCTPSTPLLTLLYTPSDSNESGTWSHITPPLPPPEGGITLYRQRSSITGLESSSPEEWFSLIPHVTPRVLDRLLPGSWSVGTLSGASAVDEESIDSDITFANIDLKRTWREGAVGRERTEQARDRSWKLETVLQEAGGREDLMGEWEVAFVSAVSVGSYSAAEQWRRVVELVLTSRRAVGEMGGFYIEFLAVLRRMVDVLEGEVMDDGYLGEDGERIKTQLKGFGRALREEGIMGSVVRAWEEFVDHAKQNWDWTLDTRDYLRRGNIMTEEGDVFEVQEEGLDEEEEKGEYAPVVVDMAEDAMEAASDDDDDKSPVHLGEDSESDGPRF